MEIARASIDDGLVTGRDWVSFAFPRNAARAPRAVLSLARAGSMRFLRGQENANRDSLFASLGIDPGAVAAVELVHGKDIVLVGPREGYSIRVQADGVMAEGRGGFPCVTVADCMPIWIHDGASGAYGVLHSGWKGTGILSSAMRLLRERFGTAPADVDVILGPAIGPCCYRVDGARAIAFAAEFGEEATRESDGAFFLDLLSANMAIARREGIGAILAVEACTCCDPRLGSSRREGPANFTRMAACVGYFPGNGGAM